MNHKPSILILDNQAIIPFECKKFLEQKGYLVFTAKKFSEAYLIFHEHPELEAIFINTCVKDISIKDIHHISPDVKIIALTSGIEQIQVINNFSGKINKILNKPFSMEEILSCLV
jgi:DNA-binding NtrC family response regulator